MVSVVLPTFNEADNLPTVVTQIANVLLDIDYEIIVVDDDSPDETWRVASELESSFRRLRTVRRTTERGLSSAVLAGMSIARGQVLVVMDADGQHDPSAISAMVEAVANGADIALGSRTVPGGSFGPFSRHRRAISWIGTMAARSLLNLSITDPMSGFFALSRRRYESVVNQVNPRGFKILLEFLARGAHPSVVEIGYRFRAREHGTTKLTGSVVWAYLMALLDLTVGRFISSTMTLYGAIGVAILALRQAMEAALAAFGHDPASGGLSILIFEAGVFTAYAAHNNLTFRSRRRQGWAHLGGLVLINLTAAHGRLLHVSLDRFLAGVDSGLTDWLDQLSRGWTWLAGAVSAVVCNYLLDASTTWRAARHRPSS